MLIFKKLYNETEAETENLSALLVALGGGSTSTDLVQMPRQQTTLELVGASTSPISMASDGHSGMDIAGAKLELGIVENLLGAIKDGSDPAVGEYVKMLQEIYKWADGVEIRANSAQLASSLLAARELLLSNIDDYDVWCRLAAVVTPEESSIPIPSRFVLKEAEYEEAVTTLDPSARIFALDFLG